MNRGPAPRAKGQPPPGRAVDVATVFHRLREVLANDPALAEEVRRAGTPEAASEVLARIGALRGIATSAAELRAHVARLSAAAPVPLDDAQLDRVAGGVGAGEPPAGGAWRAILEALLPGGRTGG